MKALLVGLAVLVGTATFAANEVSVKNVQRFFTTALEYSRTFVEAGALVGTPLFAAQLKNAALNRYLDMSESNGGEFPPRAFLVANSYSSLGENLIVIARDTDGGSYLYVYTTDGQSVAEAVRGKSGELRW